MGFFQKVLRFCYTLDDTMSHTIEIMDKIQKKILDKTVLFRALQKLWNTE